RTVVDLHDEVLDPEDGSEPMSLIRSIQLLGEYEPSGNTVEQNANGEIQVVSEKFSGAVLPVQVMKADPDAVEGTYITDDGDIMFITVTRRMVLTYPVLQDKPVFAADLDTLGLNFSYDARANLFATLPLA